MDFVDKLREIFSLDFPIGEDFYDSLIDTLVEGDFGPVAAVELIDRLQKCARKEKIKDHARLQERLMRLLTDALPDVNPVVQIDQPNGSQNGPLVILLLGVNGVGKTTTAAKLAAYYRERGKKPILAAADTFRAGAINQLKIHGEKLGVRVVAHQQGGDPAAVVYDAVEAALAGGGDLIIADTAGRMHTKTELVEELKKIDRVLETRLGKKYWRLKWLVLDATTGRNAALQAEAFYDAVTLDGSILTKYDSSAKGGIVFSLASELKIPTLFLCDGEGYDHIRVFDKSAFVKEFLG